MMMSTRENGSARSACHRASFARSLSSIHFDKAADLLPLSSTVNDHAVMIAAKKHRGRKKIRHKNSSSNERNQQGSCSSSSATSNIPTRTSGRSNEQDEMQQLGDLSQELLDEKIQRQSVPLTLVSFYATSTESNGYSTNSNATKPAVRDKPQNNEFKETYTLGDTLRFPAHASNDPSSNHRPSECGHPLQVGDFAFVKRSDGSYSYSILAGRLFEPVKGASKRSSPRELMVFLIDDRGSTKTVRQSRLSECVRLVPADE